MTTQGTDKWGRPLSWTEDQHFAEDERIREAMGMPGPPTFARASLDPRRQLLTDVRALVKKLNGPNARTATIDLPSGRAVMTVRDAPSTARSDVWAERK